MAERYRSIYQRAMEDTVRDLGPNAVSVLHMGLAGRFQEVLERLGFGHVHNINDAMETMAFMRQKNITVAELIAALETLGCWTLLANVAHARKKDAKALAKKAEDKTSTPVTPESFESLLRDHPSLYGEYRMRLENLQRDCATRLEALLLNTEKQKDALVAEFEQRRLEQYTRRCNDNLHCSICLDERPGVYLVPCGHVTSCTGCAEKLEQCPICRVEITDRLPAFV